MLEEALEKLPKKHKYQEQFHGHIQVKQQQQKKVHGFCILLYITIHTDCIMSIQYSPKQIDFFYSLNLEVNKPLVKISSPKES